MFGVSEILNNNNNNNNRIKLIKSDSKYIYVKNFFNIIYQRILKDRNKVSKKYKYKVILYKQQKVFNIDDKNNNNNYYY